MSVAGDANHDQSSAGKPTPNMHAKLITGEGDSTVHQSLYQGSSGAAGRPRSCVEAPAVEVGGPQAHVSVADAKEDVVDVGSGALGGTTRRHWCRSGWGRRKCCQRTASRCGPSGRSLVSHSINGVTYGGMKGRNMRNVPRPSIGA